MAALCAAPALVLGSAGILRDHRYTCYPGMEDQSGPYGMHSPDRVVVDRNLITAKGAGCAAEFAGAIIAALMGAEAAREVMTATIQGARIA